MPDTKISLLTTGAAVGGTDIFPVTQGASTVKITAANILTYVNANLTLGAAQGGTGQVSYAVGDILYASGATALSKLAGVAVGNVLISGGVTTAPSWGKVGLTTHVSGILPVANGGTNNAFFTVSGPATSAKTYTFPNANATVLTTNALVSVAQGGTGVSSSTGSGSVVLSVSPVLTGITTVAGFATAIVAKSAAYTMTTGDHTVYCDTTAAGFTITLPAASGNTGLEYDIKKIVAANTLTIDANAAETIDGALTLTLTSQYDSVKIVCDGTKWHTVSRVSTSAGSGTVTSVAALTFGTTGTDLSSSVATGTTTPVITLNVPTASAANRGALSAADWSSFNGKQAAITFGAGVLTFIGAPSSANLLAAITDETGTGVLVFNNAPTIVAPIVTGKATLSGLAVSTVAKTSAYTLTTSDYTILADATSASFALTLPTAVGNTGQRYTVKKTTAANIVTINTTSAQTIDGLPSHLLTNRWDALTVLSDGANWVKLHGKTAKSVTIIVSDPNGSTPTIGDGKVIYPVPPELGGTNLVEAYMYVTTQSTLGTPTLQIRNITQAVDMLTTRLTIDINESNSSTATIPAVIDAANDDVAAHDLLAFDLDVAGTGTKGIVVTLVFDRTA